MDQSTESDWGAGYMCVLLGCWLYVCVIGVLAICVCVIGVLAICVCVIEVLAMCVCYWGAGYMCVLLGCWLCVCVIGVLAICVCVIGVLAICVCVIEVLAMCVCYWGAGYMCVLLGWLYVCVIVMLTLQQDRMSENVAPEATISKETEEKVRLLEQAQTHLSAQHSVTEVGVVPQPSVAQGVTFFPLSAILLRVG